jgi:hypothetical protein
MRKLHEGQCGLCLHYGEDHAGSHQLLEIRKRQAASETLLDDCGHPKHADLHLKVTPLSGCDGYEPALR